MNKYFSFVILLPKKCNSEYICPILIFFFEKLNSFRKMKLFLYYVFLYQLFNNNKKI